jgi:hypothetical protein
MNTHLPLTRACSHSRTRPPPRCEGVPPSRPASAGGRRRG